MHEYQHVELENERSAVPTYRTTCSLCRCSSVLETYRLLDTRSAQMMLVRCCQRHVVPMHVRDAPLRTIADYWRLVHFAQAQRRL